MVSSFLVGKSGFLSFPPCSLVTTFARQSSEQVRWTHHGTPGCVYTIGKRNIPVPFLCQLRQTNQHPPPTCHFDRGDWYLHLHIFVDHVSGFQLRQLNWLPIILSSKGKAESQLTCRCPIETLPIREQSLVLKIPSFGPHIS